jgi:hypothetical protein
VKVVNASVRVVLRCWLGRRVGAAGGQRLPALWAPTCINGSVVAFVDWAVFENELKWYWTGPRCGSTTPTPTACVLDFCDRLGKPARGHCVFWAVDGVMQQWIRTSAATGTSSCTPGSFLSTLTQVGPAWLCLPTLRQMGPVLYVRDTCRWKGVVVVHSLTGGVGVAHLMTARHDRTKKMK